jgi:1-acyl-sn-glycerol-3-phosphate acyltransferase
MFQLLYILYTWLVLVPVMIVVTVVMGIICLALAPTLGPRRTSRLTAVPWARIGLWLSGIRVRIDGRDNIKPGQSYVIVANHLSHIDIWLLYGYLGLDFRWVMKQELRHVPVIGISCAALGHVFIDRSDHEKALASLDDAKRRIVDGTSILFFPEGTRSRNGQLQAFKKGAFRMALDLDLPVLPVTLSGTRAVLRPDSALLRPGVIRLQIHEALPVSGRTPEELAEASRRTILAGLHDQADGAGGDPS